MLKCVCDTHNLPLAQTWAPCIQQGKGGCRHSDENYAHCVSTVDSACYVADTQVSGFHEACSEHHLLKGEGIAGKAFWTNQPCFSQDIKAFRKTEYPLAHHAAVFNLCAAVAIRLRSIYTGKADFVLEFFLPLNYKDEKDQRLILLDSLSTVIEQTCQSLRVVTDQELAQETSKGDDSSSSSSSSWITHMMMDPKQKGKGVTVSLGGKQHKVEPEEEFKVTTTQWDNNSGLDLDENFSLAASGHLSLASAKRSIEKRRAKTEKAIGLEVLRQYFAGSLKDAARSIGVCPTTLKRICRHHGITRWPSRKIKKVGHSLKKLQLVIDSVQGAEGSIQLSSFYNNFPELVSPPNVAPGSSHSPTSKIIGHLPEKSPSSSDGHSSSSSYCVSTGVKQSSDFPVNGDALSEEQTKGGGVGGMLKRARSDAELHDLGQEETKQQLLVRSYSHKIFSTQNTNAPVVPKSNTTNVETFRVKATFGEEKIRLSMQPNWDFKNLQQEVLRRFNIDIGIRMDLKYLDDDAEWVLLTCDDDLEECIDIHRSCKSRTIKISVNQASSYHPSLGSSFCSNGPF
ncbi:hypothetical protein RD792_002236 [Penstemon davidsonii]|uniref:Nodule inception protein n=1 Tax=Penstemon davidsonii TaxID=160366 RepID=A0ABR0DRJ8_9LAMI|nr:hypothetical protein RD792_002236 [Penstemon davidsonii]